MTKFLTYIFIFFFTFILSVNAQVAEDIQRHQQNLIEAGFQQQELDRAIQKTQSSAPEYVKTETKSTKSQKCVDVRKVEFDGNTKISTHKIDKIIKPYLNKCLTVDDINKILNAVTNAYIDAGYITSGAYLVSRQTKLADGILQIKIIEGTITKFTGISEAERKTAFPWVLGSVFNLRDIEQGLDQMNRLSSNHAKMEIKANEIADGTSQVVITNEKGGTTELSLYTDNLGSESVGEYRAGLGLVQDNLFGINDQINLGYTNSLSDTWHNKYSRALSLGMSVPFGYWTFTNNTSYSEYKTYMILPVSKEKLYSYGDNFSESFIVDRVISRGQRYKVSLSASINYKEPNNYTHVLDIITKNEASSRKLAFLEYGLPMTFYFNNGVIFAKPSYVDGKTLFGIPRDDGTYPQKAQFDAYKLYLYSGWNLGFANFTTVLDGQYTKDEVLSSETVYIGGETSVRGFRDNGVSGDSGFYIRNDLDFNLSQIFGTNHLLAKSITPGLFFDYGWVKSNADKDKVELSGAGAKLSFSYGLLDASVSYAIPIKRENDIEDKGVTSAYIGIKGRI